MLLYKYYLCFIRYKNKIKYKKIVRKTGKIIFMTDSESENEDN